MLHERLRVWQQHRLLRAQVERQVLQLLLEQRWQPLVLPQRQWEQVLQRQALQLRPRLRQAEEQSWAALLPRRYGVWQRHEWLLREELLE